MIPALRLTRSKVTRRLVACALSVLALSPGAQAQSLPEDAVKAAFLYRFADYVEWPAPALQGASFTIAVLDDELVASDLAKILASHRIKDHPSRVRVAHRLADIADAQMVFIAAGDPDAHRRLIQQLNGYPILIVTDEANGLDEGSAVNFLLIDRRIRFEISLTAASHQGLRISSDLLSVATRVEGRLSLEAECGGRAPGRVNLASCRNMVATRGVSR